MSLTEKIVKGGLVLSLLAGSTAAYAENISLDKNIQLYAQNRIEIPSSRNNYLGVERDLNGSYEKGEIDPLVPFLVGIGALLVTVPFSFSDDSTIKLIRDISVIGGFGSIVYAGFRFGNSR